VNSLLNDVNEITVVLGILGVTVVLFVWNRFPVELVAVGASLALVATGVIDIHQALDGFGDPTVVFIATLFVVSTALDATGVTAWAGQRLTSMAGDSKRRLLVFTMLFAAGLTAIISVNGAVAALLPMVVVTAVRRGEPTSMLLLPMAFAAHAGSQLALTGTPVNVLVSEAAYEAGAGTFGFFEFALVGVPLLIGTIVIAVVLGPRLLPRRSPASLPPDLSAHARTLSRQYLMDQRVFRLSVVAGSGAVGSEIETFRADLPDGVQLVGVQQPGETLPVLVGTLAEGSIVIVRGELEAVRGLVTAAGLHLHPEPFTTDGELLGHRVGVAELVVPPRSGLIGATVFPGMVTDSGDLVILAVQRKGADLGAAKTELAAGDTLLVQGAWKDLDREVDADRDVIAVHQPSAVRAQAVPLGPKAIEALLVTGGMVVLLASGRVAPAVAGLLAVGALVLLKVLTVPQAYRGISWTTVVLVAAMIPVSTAMQVSGAAGEVAEVLVDLVGGGGPSLLLFGIFVICVAFGAMISNTATALIVIPIALSAAAELDVSPKPVLLAVSVSCAAALLTPVSTPANLMVMEPGAYKFSDYPKFGLPILALYGVLVVFYIPLIWSL
jgi:di/tricarboxylate transporter